MKRILILVLGVLMFTGVVNAQTNERALVAKERAAIDSIAAAVNAPTPVAVSTSDVFAGITMISGSAGSATNLKSGRRTFPVTGGINVDGAKALALVISWSNFEHGGFRVEHRFSSSATDTSLFYFNGNSTLDTFAVSDSSQLWNSKCGNGEPLNTASDSTAYEIPPDVSGSIVIRIPDVPGVGYYFCRIRPWGTAHVNYIAGLSAVLRKVE